MRRPAANRRASSRAARARSAPALGSMPASTAPSAESDAPVPFAPMRGDCTSCRGGLAWRRPLAGGGDGHGDDPHESIELSARRGPRPMPRGWRSSRPSSTRPTTPSSHRRRRTSSPRGTGARSASSAGPRTTSSASRSPMLFVPAVRSTIEWFLDVVASGDRIERFETDIERKGGMPTPIALTLYPVVRPAAAVAGAAAVARDLTEQRLAQATLAETEARMREGESLAHVGRWLWDIGSGTVQWSDELHRIHGVDPSTSRATSTPTSPRRRRRTASGCSTRCNGPSSSAGPSRRSTTSSPPPTSPTTSTPAPSPPSAPTGSCVGLRGIVQDVRQPPEPRPAADSAQPGEVADPLDEVVGRRQLGSSASGSSGDARFDHRRQLAERVPGVGADARDRSWNSSESLMARSDRTTSSRSSRPFLARRARSRRPGRGAPSSEYLPLRGAVARRLDLEADGDVGIDPQHQDRRETRCRSRGCRSTCSPETARRATGSRRCTTTVPSSGRVTPWSVAVPRHPEAVAHAEGGAVVEVEDDGREPLRVDPPEQFGVVEPVAGAKVADGDSTRADGRWSGTISPSANSTSTQPVEPERPEADRADRGAGLDEHERSGPGPAGTGAGRPGADDRRIRSVDRGGLGGRRGGAGRRSSDGRGHRRPRRAPDGHERRSRPRPAWRRRCRSRRSAASTRSRTSRSSLTTPIQARSTRAPSSVRP